MRHLPTLLLLAGLPAASLAQQWCAPEATWTYEYSGWSADYREQYRYLGDTVLGGLPAQRIRVDVIGTLGGPPFIDSAMQYTAIQDDLIMLWDGWGSPLAWDTLYWFGEPGDRWYPIGAPQDCAPYGMIEITDTGHVVIDDVSLRTWNSTYLNEQGQPMSAPLLLTERIGATPRIPWISSCTIIVEYYFAEFLCYSDVDITVPYEVPCDLTTMLPPTAGTGSSAMVFPNPGSDQLMISGLPAGSNIIDVRDALGRNVVRPVVSESAPLIDASAWASGTYHIVVTTSDGTRQVLRWVKE